MRAWERPKYLKEHRGPAKAAKGARLHQEAFLIKVLVWLLDLVGEHCEIAEACGRSVGKLAFVINEPSHHIGVIARAYSVLLDVLPADELRLHHAVPSVLTAQV